MMLMTSIGLMATLYQLLTPCLFNLYVPTGMPHPSSCHTSYYSIKRIASHGV